MTSTATREITPEIVEPGTVAELGLDSGVLLDITIKTLFYRGRMTRTELADSLKISGTVVSELMHALTQDALVTVLGAEGTGPAAYMYQITQKGLERAEAAFNRSGYVGPVPVPVDQYIAQVRRQTVKDTVTTREEVLDALGPLVLAEETVSRIGRAASSRKASLIYGASGNGKTTAVRIIGDVVGGTIHVPHAIEMVGQIVHVYDPSKHEVVREYESSDNGLLKTRADRRWIQVKRPVIWAGGELTRHSLELVYDDNTKIYEAPLQLKANGGCLIIDDFGRQQMPAVQLLNRWIVALENGVDHLTLHTGQTIEIPFDVLILFSTNLPPERLADEAFLRRIRYKVEIPNPTPEEYRAIFRRECDKQGMAYNDDAVTRLFEEWYKAHNREVRGCHPRDLTEAIVDAAHYEGRKPELTVETLDEACTTYFLRPMNAPH